MSQARAPVSRPAGRLLAGAILAVLGATLFPTSPGTPRRWIACVLCGEAGTADALLNVILFVPLGAALALCRWPGRRAVLSAALLSSGIEFAQLFVPGRDSSFGDVLFNTLGAGLGLLVARTVASGLALDQKRCARLSLWAAGAAVALFAVTGHLLGPSFPESTYYGQWTANLGHLEWYRGRVLKAALGPFEIPSRRLVNSARVRRLLFEGAALDVRAVAGPPIGRLGPIVSIFDNRQREIMLLGLVRDDLVFRYRTRAGALRLDQPDLRVPGSMRGIAPGDTIHIAVWHAANGYCVALNLVQTCYLGFTVGDGWTILLYPKTLRSWFKMVLNAGWVAALCVPVGFWARRRWESALASVALLAGLVALPAATPLLATPPAQLLGALGGLLVGASLQLRRRSNALASSVTQRSSRASGRSNTSLR